MSRYLKKELEIKKRNPKHYNKIDEIKGINIIPNDCSIILQDVISNIKNFISFSIVICKKDIILKKHEMKMAHLIIF